MGSLLAPRAMLLPLTLLLLALLARVHGQFPSVCPLNINPRVRSRCCPVWSGDGSECGSKSGRGRCVAGPASNPNYADERMNYPWELYSHVCNCNFPFGRYNCGGCTSNRQGPTCSTVCKAVRKPLTHLTPGEISAFRNTLILAKNTQSPWCSIFLEQGTAANPTYSLVPASIYDCLASAHAFNSKDVKGTEFDMIHEGPAFLTWHRWFLMAYEQMMQEVSGNCSMAIPYWDWRYSKDLTALTFTGWKVHCGESDSDSYCRMPVNVNERADLIREIGKFEDTLPTPQDVANTMKWTTVDRPPYDAGSQTCFRNPLEGFIMSSDGVTPSLGMHNQVHVHVGGDMLSTMTATSDPVFFAHHCMIDCVLDAWIVKNKANAQSYPPCPYEGHHPEDNLAGSFPPVRNMDMFYPLSTFGSSYYYARPLE